RMRSASAGSASRRTAGAAPSESAPPARTPRRSRSASEGSASQRAAAEPGRRSTDAPWLKPAEPSGETSDDAARRVHAAGERTEVPPGEGGGVPAANAPEDDTPEPRRETPREPGTGTGTGGDSDSGAGGAAKGGGA
ncbi:hypothetical protein LJ221_18855, partial [Streptomyces sp. CNQ085]|nr:hypothetical protein [Streptomyces sp. CNQ085]